MYELENDDEIDLRELFLALKETVSSFV